MLSIENYNNYVTSYWVHTSGGLISNENFTSMYHTISIVRKKT